MANEDKTKLFSKFSKYPQIILADPYISYFFQVLPRKAISGYGLKIIEVKNANLITAEFIAKGGNPPSGESEWEADALEFIIKTVGTDVKIDLQDIDVYTAKERADFEKNQIIMAWISIMDTISKMLIKGDSGTEPEKPDGLDILIKTAQTIGANNDASNGGPLQLNDLTRLVYKVKGWPDYLIANTTSLEKYKDLMDAAGLELKMVYDQTLQLELPSFMGIPILQDDFIENTYSKGSGTNLTKIYAVRLGWEKGLVLIVPEGREDNFFKMRRIVEESTDTEKLRISASCALALFAETAVAALEGIETA